jgi:hypothetical protein
MSLLIKLIFGIAAGAILGGIMSPANAGTRKSAFSAEIAALCRPPIAKMESQYQFPRMLLSAISLAESGRWHAGRRESFAWPWTITSASDTWYFDSKVEAVAFSVTDEEDLLRTLRPGIDGLILSDGKRRATFLPQVWEQLKTPEVFVRQLKRKAGLADDFWSDQMTFLRYTTFSFGRPFAPFSAK